ncbi:MAG: methyltransferase domain-containing protein [Candidatus Nitrosopumilus sp. bin_6a]
MTESKCRFCNESLETSFVDLGFTPLSNSFLKKQDLENKEKIYPLHAFICKNCLLVQLEEFEKPENIFSDYAYFSSYSKTWLEHARKYSELMISNLKLNESSKVIEVASNDGYLLQFFKDKKISVLGIEPAQNVAKVAQEKGIPTISRFFGIKFAKELAEKGIFADLLLGNNVLAHVPDINDFVEGMKIILKKRGVITLEFPHILQLIKNNQFDTVYHEHFSYFSFYTVQKIFSHHKLRIFDVEELPTHGGSLRIYVKHEDDELKQISENVEKLNLKEKDFGCTDFEKYIKFQKNIDKIKEDVNNFFIMAMNQKKKVVGYGAPAKGNTLLNYCEINNEMMEYTVDISEYKQGLFLPGTHIPIYNPSKIKDSKPDYIFILPWNLKKEIMKQLEFIREWGGKFIIPIPEVKIL